MNKAKHASQKLVNRLKPKGDPPHMAGSSTLKKPKAMLGKTAKKPENDDRPLRHGKTQRRHKLAQKLEQAKL